MDFRSGALGLLGLALLVGASSPPAWAAKPGIAFPTGLTPAKFISNCESMGGTVTRVGQGTIKCTLPSGTEVTCAFDSGGTVCTWRGDTTTAGLKPLLGDTAPAAVNPNASTKQPKASAAPSGADTVN